MAAHGKARGGRTALDEFGRVGVAVVVHLPFGGVEAWVVVVAVVRFDRRGGRGRRRGGGNIGRCRRWRGGTGTSSLRAVAFDVNRSADGGSSSRIGIDIVVGRPNRRSGRRSGRRIGRLAPAFLIPLIGFLLLEMPQPQPRMLLPPPRPRGDPPSVDGRRRAEGDDGNESQRYAVSLHNSRISLLVGTLLLVHVWMEI